ncbi:histidine kinase dimerization/phospho-acceptor domain-containing protein, partial [Gilvimarinus sp. 1_MG-2023]|uniref:histidine kinase dimerization/phospho-acceptor domain-containing protein n=1 Tax=Gilvimarinus sp. 1_MG-2023 TaxID=3062638 RepID=UPI0026E2C145
IDSEQLNNRLDPNQAPSELVPLIQAFNDMLSRLETGFERLSNFSADIAHELRTPLTNLITQTQLMLGQPRDLNAYRELLYSSLEEEERLARMVADML